MPQIIIPVPLQLATIIMAIPGLVSVNYILSTDVT